MGFSIPIIEKQKHDLILAVDLSDFPLGILGPIARRKFANIHQSLQ